MTQLIGLYTPQQAKMIFAQADIKEPLPTVKTQVIKCHPYEKAYFTFKKEKHGDKWFIAQYMTV